MTPDDDAPDDALTRDYRRGSAAEAGRPAAATRAAILAEARALAERRARKDPRIPWALAASVAVIGIAVLLWRQVGLQTGQLAGLPIQAVPSVPIAPAAAPVAEPATQNASAAVGKVERAAPAAEVAARPPVALPPSPSPITTLAKAQVEPERPVAADAVTPAHLESAFRAAAPAAPGPATALSAGAGAATTAAASALSASPRLGDTEAPASVLRKRFPEDYSSPSPPHTLWLVRDTRGEVLRTGKLNDSASLSTVSVDLRRDYPDRRMSSWTITPLTNERGVPVELAIATLSD